MKKLLCLLAFSLFLLGCEKDKSLECVDSIVFWGGDPAADGMGWYLSDGRGSGNNYYVDDLPAEFQTDSLPVRVCLVKTGKKRNCFCLTRPPVHRIKHISRR
ncbi:MAG TPA: hypothetical protein VGB46_03375 [Flavisolibacter sp.]|jgi:hypothetical protein